MINKMFHDLLFGKITFSVKEGFRDMFISLCREENVILSDITEENGILKGSVMQRDITAVINAAKKSGMKIEILKRFGLPHFFYRYRKRLGVPAGVLIFTIIMRILTLTVWSVEISGNEHISSEKLSEILETNGVSRGVFTDSIQSKDIEYVLYNELEELLWVKVYITGSRVFVDIRERNMEETAEDKNAYSNIVAGKDGEVVRADIFSGEGKIYPGTAVVKGDMLVNGVITFSDGSVKFVNSEAEIYARTKNTVSTSAALTVTAGKPVNSYSRKVIYFFGIEIPIGKSDKDNYFTTDRRFFKSADIVFPLGIFRENYFSLQNGQIELTPAKAALVSFRDFSKASFEIYKNCEVLERTISVDFSSQIIFEAEYLCVEDIAMEKSFTVNEED